MMNKQDRTRAAKILEQIQALKTKQESEWAALAEEVRELASQEEEKFENMSEGLQEGEQGQAIQQAAETLNSAADALEEMEFEDAEHLLEEVA